MRCVGRCIGVAEAKLQMQTLPKVIAMTWIPIRFVFSDQRFLAIALLIPCLCCVSCTRNEPESNSTADADLPPVPDVDSVIAAEQQADAGPLPASVDSVGKNRMSDDSDRSVPGGSSPVSANLSPLPPPTSPLVIGDGNPLTVEGELDATAARPLRADLSPPELETFLAQADRDLELALTGPGQTDQAARLRSAKNIARVKLEAARRLLGHDDATEEQQIVGKRGELQGLSHLAQLRDLKAATQLETLAKTYLGQESGPLRVDAHLVMMGFTLEKLKNGVEGSVDDVVRLNEELVELIRDDNVMAMMAMGQSRDALARLEHTQASRQVRDLILRKFAQSKDPNIAQMAAGYAGSVQFDEIETLVSAIARGESVTASRWRDSVTELLSVAPDITSVRYLCGTTLECESNGQPELAEITYEILGEQVAGKSNAMAQEAELAIAFHQARQDRIGELFEEALIPLNGQDRGLEAQRGKVVLMPFWSARVPSSLLLVPLLQTMQRERPNQIALVGINLDPPNPGLAAQMQQQGLVLPSYQTSFDGNERPVSPLAERYGLGGHPMTVILDPEGRVAAITFGEKRIQAVVDQLLE